MYESRSAEHTRPRVGQELGDDPRKVFGAKSDLRVHFEAKTETGVLPRTIVASIAIGDSRSNFFLLPSGAL